jgi:Predicted pyridoxal phosphate-dependent enzyme apparently involved in regulation of cell wall biogenesis
MKKIFNYGSQYIDNKDINNVIKSLKGKELTKGPFVKKFEMKFSNYTGSKYAVSCSSGTSALHLVYKVINIKKNDIVIAPTITFAASVNPASIMGAKIIFADCDSQNGIILFESVEDIVKKLVKINKINLLKAIVLVNLNGQSANIKLYKELSKKYNFYIIEDSCHALGSSYKKPNKGKVGGCQFSDFSTFSFHPVKTITTGERGYDNYE